MNNLELTPKRELTYGERFSNIQAALSDGELPDMAEVRDLKECLTNIYIDRRNLSHDTMHYNDDSICEVIELLESISDPEQ